MTVTANAPYTLSSLWNVFMLFLIPIGGGIPAGVVLAKSRGIAWPVMMILYFVSDVVLAGVFEPFLMLIKLAGQKHLTLGKINAAFKQAMDITVARFGVNPGPLTLIAVSFGVDPMTGRAAALAAGHHFVAGWSFAIAGDMIFFSILMVSTLWLSDVLGDGTWTAIIITIAMIGIPILIRKVRESWRNRKDAGAAV